MRQMRRREAVVVLAVHVWFGDGAAAQKDKRNEIRDAKIRRRPGGGGSEQRAFNGVVRYGEWRTRAVALQIGTPRFGST